MNNNNAMRSLFRTMLWVCMALLGAHYFPLTNMFNPLSIWQLISFFIFYTVAGNLMIFLYGQHQSGRIIGYIFLSTTLGMIGQYYMVADPIAAGFTPVNIISHVATITIYVFFAYALLKPPGKV